MGTEEGRAMARFGRIVVVVGFVVAVLAAASTPRPDGIRWVAGQRPTEAALVVSELSR
jgi:hypothetical protein